MGMEYLTNVIFGCVWKWGMEPSKSEAPVPYFQDQEWCKTIQYLSITPNWTLNEYWMNTESPSPARSRKTAARSVPYSNRCRQTSPRHGSKISKSSCRSAALPHPGASANRASHGRSSHGIYPEKLPKASPILDATCLASVYVYVYIYTYAKYHTGKVLKSCIAIVASINPGPRPKGPRGLTGCHKFIAS